MIEFSHMTAFEDGHTFGGQNDRFIILFIKQHFLWCNFAYQLNLIYAEIRYTIINLKCFPIAMYRHNSVRNAQIGAKIVEK